MIDSQIQFGRDTIELITSPANRSFLCKHYSPLLFLNFDRVTSTVVLKLFFHFRKVFF